MWIEFRVSGVGWIGCCKGAIEGLGFKIYGLPQPRHAQVNSKPKALNSKPHMSTLADLRVEKGRSPKATRTLKPAC